MVSIIDFSYTGLFPAIIPFALISLSGVTIGAFLFRREFPRKVSVHSIVYGNVVTCFGFICGFIVFGWLANMAREFFDFFSFVTIALSIIGAYIVMENLLDRRTKLWYCMDIKEPYTVYQYYDIPFVGHLCFFNNILSRNFRRI